MSPGTTRQARQGEVDGLHYQFLSVDEFVALEQNGGLLESGVYQGTVGWCLEYRL